MFTYKKLCYFSDLLLILMYGAQAYIMCVYTLLMAYPSSRTGIHYHKIL